MRSIIWWRHVTNAWRVIVLLLVVTAERIIGIPFLSALLFYSWFGQHRTRGMVWWWVGFSLSLALVHRLSFGGVMAVIFAWWVILEWQFGKYIVQKWWVLLVTWGFSVGFILIYQPIYWWMVAGSWLLGTGWWQWKLRQGYERTS